MEKFYYIIEINYYSNCKYLVWYTNDYDGLLINKDIKKKLLSFDKFEHVKSFGITNNLQFKEVIRFNLKNILNSIYIYGFNYKIILDFWNLIDDITKTLYKKAFFDILKESIILEYNNKNRAFKYVFKIYDKIFFANNLEVITPKDKIYLPVWRKSELKLLRKIVQKGLSLLEKHI